MSPQHVWHCSVLIVTPIQGSLSPPLRGSPVLLSYIRSEDTSHTDDFRISYSEYTPNYTDFVTLVSTLL